MNLYQTLKSNKFQGLPVGLIKKFSIQILQALSLLDRYKVIHCDLKPENILLNPLDSSLLKVIDFGSACFYDKRIYTYIQSRYYRAPEVILELSYSTSIDMWSFGCILVEMFTGKPAFPADTELELLHSMIEILGAPPSKVINKSSRRSEYFENDGRPKFVPYYKVKRKNPGSKSLRIILKGADEGFIDLVESCLQWDQVKRIEPDEALMHRWLQECSGEPKRFKHYKSQSDVYFKKFIPIKDANII
jgi:dual specificity tyrosine-phosphorylation-regulated kinase 2/3/4